MNITLSGLVQLIVNPDDRCRFSLYI